VTVVDPAPLIAAVRDSVTAQNVAVAVGRRPGNVGPRMPWVVMWPDGGMVTDRSLLSRDGFELVAPFQCYGLEPESAIVAVRKVRTAMESLTGQVVAGRTILAPSHTAPPVLSRDDDADPPLFMYYDEWRIRTTA
jgi:hypothetical protein